MKVERFISEREGDWRELDELLRTRRRARSGARSVLRLAALYRGAAADLALARRGHPGDPVVARLESLVARARQVVYAEEIRRGSMRTFLSRTYWVHVRERPRVLALAAALLLVPALLAALWAIDDPGAAVGIVPGQFRGAVEPVGDTGMSAGESAAFSSAVMTNNIQVTFLAFAAGIALGLGTALVVAYNGAILGAVAGGAIANGNGAEFAEFVTAHGVIELTCIVVAAAAGIRVGDAILSPGRTHARASARRGGAHGDRDRRRDAAVGRARRDHRGLRHACRLRARAGDRARRRRRRAVLDARVRPRAPAGRSAAARPSTAALAPSR